MMAGAPDQVRDPLIDMVQYPKRLGLPREFASLSQQIVKTLFKWRGHSLDGAIRMAPSKNAKTRDSGAKERLNSR